MLYDVVLNRFFLSEIYEKLSYSDYVSRGDQDEIKENILDHHIIKYDMTNISQYFVA